MPTFMFNRESISKGLVSLSPKESNHLINVLRVRPSEMIKLTDGQGNLFEGVLVQTDKGTKISILKGLPKPPRPYPITLYVSILKSEKMEWIVQKSVELNIESVSFVKTSRSIRPHISESKWQRLQRIAHEATKQSGRAYPLILERHDGGATAIQKNSAKDVSHLICVEHGADQPLKDYRRNGPSASSYGLWIGPEGGWSVDEIRWALDSGFKMVSLGPLILRSETAAIHAVSTLIALI